MEEKNATSFISFARGWWRQRGTNQKISVCAIVVAAIGVISSISFSIINLYIKLDELNRKVTPIVEMKTQLQTVVQMKQQLQTVIEMKPQIQNTINNVVEVKKEIANLTEVLRQQDELKKSERFNMLDVGKKVRKYYPSEEMGPTAAGFVIVELAAVPLKNSITISSENKVFSPAIYSAKDNIITMKFLQKGAEGLLTKNTDFLSVEYIPDVENNGIVSIKECGYTSDGFDCAGDKSVTEVSPEKSSAH